MKNFNEIYEKVYKENNKDLENLRYKNVKKIVINIIIVLLLGICLVPFSKSAYALVFLLLIYIIAENLVPNPQYASKFKLQIIKLFVENIDENMNYDSKRGISRAVYREGEFEHYDFYYSEDLIEGVLEGKYKIQMAEVLTQIENTDSDGNRGKDTVFHGIFGCVDCDKIIGNLKIRSNKNSLGNMLKNKERIEMDSEEFEKYFDVYGYDKIKAMQFLTSEVMTMMIDFINESKIKYEITIKPGKIYIRFHTGPVFEPKILKKALDYDTLKKYYDMIEFIFRIAKELNKAIEESDI